jgi:hypothetical protein
VSEELQAERAKIEDTVAHAKTFSQMFVGADERFYVKNLFNNDYASYARYPSKDVYDFGEEIHTFEHVSHDEAMSQFEREVLHEFTIIIDNKKQILFCNLVGELIEPQDEITLMKDYLKQLFKQHGKDAVKFTHKEVCSEHSSKI